MIVNNEVEIIISATEFYTFISKTSNLNVTEEKLNTFIIRRESGSEKLDCIILKGDFKNEKS